MKSLQWTSLLLWIFGTSISVEAGILPFEEAFLTYDQNHSTSEGNEFVVGFMTNGQPSDPREPDRPGNAYIIVSTRDEDPVSFTVTRLFDDDDATRVSTHTVTYNQTVRVLFRPTNDVIIEGAENDKAIGVKAAEGKKISVYVVSDEFRSTDGYVALPCDAMVVPGDFRRYEYIIHSTSQLPTAEVSQRFSQILLIACFDGGSGTSVTPTQSITPPRFSPGECGPGTTNERCSWQDRGAMDAVLITSAADLSGTLIRSEKPLVVVTGHQCGEVPRGNIACDFIAEQLPPHTTWGYTHILVPLAVRRIGDYYRIAAYLDDTVVNITCVDYGSSNPSTETYTLDRMGVQTYTTHPSDTADCSDSFRYKYCVLQASKPVSVTQYSYGFSRDRTCFGSEIGDPFISVVPPITQYMNKYTFTEVEADAGDFTTFSYINVAVHARFFDPSQIYYDDSLLGADRSKWQAVYCADGDICGYAITKNISGMGTHTVHHSMEDAGIYVHLYGFQNQNSYGFPVGMELEPIAGAVIICAPPNSCIPEGESRTIICTRTLDLDFGSRFTVTSEDGTAQAGTDYTAVNIPDVRFTRGNSQIRSSDSIDVTTLTDGNDDEPVETFYLKFSPTRNAIFIPPKIEIKICGREDTVEPVTVSFDPTTYTVIEGEDNVANLMLVRSGGLTRTVVVTVNLRSETATAGSDYSGPVTTTVTFEADETTASVPVPIVDDSDVEDTETFTATLSTTDSGMTIGDDTATVDIVDNDMCPDSTAPENGNVTVTGYRTGDMAEYSCDQGYELVGDRTRECMMDSQWSGQTPSCQISPVTVFFNPTTYTVTEGEGVVANLTLIRSGGLSRTVVVTVSLGSASAMAGSDYSQPVVTTVTFGPDQTSASYIVPIVDDSVVEFPEYFAALLSTTESNVNIVDGTAIVDIVDDDLPCVQLEQTVYDVVEADEAVEVCVITCSDIGDREIKIHVFGPNGEKIPPGAAIATPDELDIFGQPMRAAGTDYFQQVEGANYLRENDIVINAANPRICYNETIYGDILDEPMEYYGLTLLVYTPEPDDDDARIKPGYDTAAVRIVDDDEPDPEFDMTMYTVPEDDRTTPMLCIDIGVLLLEPVTFTIDTAQKSPAEAEEADYTSGTTITVSPPGPTACIDFTDLVVDDDLASEGGEAFAISIRGHGEMAMVTILDDDEVSVGFDPTSYIVLEGDSEQLVIVKRGETEGPIEIFVSTSGGTATAGDDYNEITNERVVFNPGISTQTVTLTTLSDALSEGDEDLTATIAVDVDDSGIGVFDPEAFVTITESIASLLPSTTSSPSTEVHSGNTAVLVSSMTSSPSTEVHSGSTTVLVSSMTSSPSTEVHSGSTTVSVSLFPSTPPSMEEHSEDGTLYIYIAMSGAAVVLIVAAVIVISVIVCLKKKQKVDKINIMNVADNVAHGTSKDRMELSENIAYGTTTFKGNEDGYEYVSTTVNDIDISTSANEAYATTNNVPVVNNQAYGMLHH